MTNESKKTNKKQAAIYLALFINALRQSDNETICEAYGNCFMFYILSGISKRTHKKHALDALKRSGLQMEFILFMYANELMPFWQV